MRGLAIGSRIEVEADGEWWNAEVVGLTSEEVQIHFEGGTEDENEWIFLDSQRLRAPQDDGGDDDWEEDEGEEMGEMGDNEGSAAAPRGARQPKASKDGAKRQKAKAKDKGNKVKTEGGKDRKEPERKLKKGADLPDGWARVMRRAGRWTYIAPDGKEFTSQSHVVPYDEELRMAGAIAGMNGAEGKGTEGKGESGGKSTAGKKEAGGGKKRKRDEMVMDDDEDTVVTARAIMPKHGGAFGKEMRTFEHKWLYEERFESVRGWLIDEGVIAGDDQTRNNKFLARVTDIIHQSQYIHLGKEAIGEKRDLIVRLPQSIFLDKSPGGGLCVLLHETIDYMRTKGYSADGLERTMFKQVSDVDFKHMRLFESIHARLVAADLIVYPAIYFSPDMVKTLTKGQYHRYQNIAKSHGATVAHDEDDATHIIVPDTDGMAYDPKRDFCRTLALRTGKKKDALAYVHWWFFPDSYDEWLSQHVIQGDVPEPAKVTSGVFKVCLRWLEDTLLFNEWMNEEDYEPEEDEEGDADAKGRKAWSEEEHRRLVEARQQGASWGDIAKELGRKESAVKSKWGQKKHQRIAEFEGGSKKQKKGDTAKKSVDASPVKAEKSKTGKSVVSKSVDRRSVGGKGDAKLLSMSSKGEGGKGRSGGGEGSGLGMSKEPRKEKVKKQQVNRLLTATHECWDDEADLQASFQAEPLTWDLPPLSEYIASQPKPSPIEGDAHAGEGSEVGDKSSTPAVEGPPLLLHHSCSWFSLEEADPRETASAPEYFDGKTPGKTPEAYIWYRNAVVGLWCNVMAEWAANAVGPVPAGEQQSGKSKKKKPKNAAVGRAPPRIHVPPAPKLSLQRCLDTIPGTACDIMRAFEVLSDHGIINSDCFKSEASSSDDDGVPSARFSAAAALVEAFHRCGLDWDVMSSHVDLASKEECILAFSAAALAATPHSLLPQPKHSPPAAPGGMELLGMLRGEDADALRRNARHLQASIGVAAAAASAEVCIAEARARIEAQNQECGQFKSSDAVVEHLQDVGCRGALLVGMAARAKVLAHRETMEIMAKVVIISDLQMLRVHEKLTLLLHLKKELALARRAAHSDL